MGNLHYILSVRKLILGLKLELFNVKKLLKCQEKLYVFYLHNQQFVKIQNHIIVKNKNSLKNLVLVKHLKLIKKLF